MKKFTIAAATVLLLGGLNACTSDYVCTCDVDFGGLKISVDTTFTDVSRSEASDECSTLEEESNDPNFPDLTTTCESSRA